MDIKGGSMGVCVEGGLGVWVGGDAEGGGGVFEWIDVIVGVREV